MLKKRLLVTLLPPKPKRAVLFSTLISKLWVPRKLNLAIDFELPDFAQALGLLLANGLPVNVALGWLTPRATGELSSIFHHLRAELELGADPVELLKDLSKHPNPGLAELAEKLAVAITRGAPISAQIMAHAASARANLQRRMLRQAGSNETKMLIPIIFCILPITVLFAIFPSLLVLGGSF